MVPILYLMLLITSCGSLVNGWFAAQASAASRESNSMTDRPLQTSIQLANKRRHEPSKDRHQCCGIVKNRHYKEIKSVLFLVDKKAYEQFDVGSFTVQVQIVSHTKKNFRTW